MFNWNQIQRDAAPGFPQQIPNQQGVVPFPQQMAYQQQPWMGGGRPGVPMQQAYPSMGMMMGPNWAAQQGVFNQQPRLLGMPGMMPQGVHGVAPAPPPPKEDRPPLPAEPPPPLPPSTAASFINDNKNKGAQATPRDEAKPPLPPSEPPPPLPNQQPPQPPRLNQQSRPLIPQVNTSSSVIQPPQPDLQPQPTGHVLQKQPSFPPPPPPEPQKQKDPALIAELDKVKLEESMFLVQYDDWKKQYDTWREQNQHHPNKEQFEQYMEQWKIYEQQMEARRRAIAKQKADVEKRIEDYAAVVEPPKPEENNTSLGNFVGAYKGNEQNTTESSRKEAPPPPTFENNTAQPPHTQTQHNPPGLVAQASAQPNQFHQQPSYPEYPSTSNQFNQNEYSANAPDQNVHKGYDRPVTEEGDEMDLDEDSSAGGIIATGEGNWNAQNMHERAWSNKANEQNIPSSGNYWPDQRDDEFQRNTQAFRGRGKGDWNFRGSGRGDPNIVRGNSFDDPGNQINFRGDQENEFNRPVHDNTFGNSSADDRFNRPNRGRGYFGNNGNGRGQFNNQAGDFRDGSVEKASFDGQSAFQQRFDEENCQQFNDAQENEYLRKGFHEQPNLQNSNTFDQRNQFSARGRGNMHNFNPDRNSGNRMGMSGSIENPDIVFSDNNLSSEMVKKYGEQEDYIQGDDNDNFDSGFHARDDRKPFDSDVDFSKGSENFERGFGNNYENDFEPNDAFRGRGRGGFGGRGYRDRGRGNRQERGGMNRGRGSGQKFGGMDRGRGSDNEWRGMNRGRGVELQRGGMNTGRCSENEWGRMNKGRGFENDRRGVNRGRGVEHERGGMNRGRGGMNVDQFNQRRGSFGNRGDDGRGQGPKPLLSFVFSDDVKEKHKDFGSNENVEVDRQSNENFNEDFNDDYVDTFQHSDIRGRGRGGNFRGRGRGNLDDFNSDRGNFRGRRGARGIRGRAGMSSGFDYSHDRLNTPSRDENLADFGDNLEEEDFSRDNFPRNNSRGRGWINRGRGRGFPNSYNQYPQDQDYGIDQTGDFPNQDISFRGRGGRGRARNTIQDKEHESFPDFHPGDFSNHQDNGLGSMGRGKGNMGSLNEAAGDFEPDFKKPRLDTSDQDPSISDDPRTTYLSLLRQRDRFKEVGNSSNLTPEPNQPDTMDKPVMKQPDFPMPTQRDEDRFADQYEKNYYDRDTDRDLYYNRRDSNQDPYYLGGRREEVDPYSFEPPAPKPIQSIDYGHGVGVTGEVENQVKAPEVIEYGHGQSTIDNSHDRRDFDRYRDDDRRMMYESSRISPSRSRKDSMTRDYDYQDLSSDRFADEYRSDRASYNDSRLERRSDATSRDYGHGYDRDRRGIFDCDPRDRSHDRDRRGIFDRDSRDLSHDRGRSGERLETERDRDLKLDSQYGRYDRDVRSPHRLSPSQRFRDRSRDRDYNRHGPGDSDSYRNRFDTDPYRRDDRHSKHSDSYYNRSPEADRDRDLILSRDSRRREFDSLDHNRDRYYEDRDFTDIDRDKSDRDSFVDRHREILMRGTVPERHRDRHDEYRGEYEGERDITGRRHDSHITERDRYGRPLSPEKKSTPGVSQSPQGSMSNKLPVAEVTKIEDILCAPGRSQRPANIVIIIRGLPGSGKTYISKLLREKEISNGGSAPRMLCLDDYFMTEVEKQVVDPDTNKKVKKRMLEYEYEQALEEAYRQSLLKSFKKTVDDGFFPFIILDATNEKVAHFSEFWSYAKSKGFQVYVGEPTADVSTCIQRNIHNWTEWDIEKVKNNWEPLPTHYIRLDLRWLLQLDSIPEVEMEDSTIETKEDENSAAPEKKENEEDDDEEKSGGYQKSKWELDTSEKTLDKLDGIRVSKKHIQQQLSLEEFLQLDDDYFLRESLPGKKRVRWADLEEKKEQTRRRDLGFIVGQTQRDWQRITDDDLADKALNQTKYFYKN